MGETNAFYIAVAWGFPGSNMKQSVHRHPAQSVGRTICVSTTPIKMNAFAT